MAVPANQLYQFLRAPTLFHLSGQQSKRLFISVLLHGNETSGWEAVRQYLKLYKNKLLPRSISLFIGNIQAARYGKRVLDHQQDYNRSWSTEQSDNLTEEQDLMRQVIVEMSRLPLFASIDLHNNTGLNPYYSCINHRQNEFYHLAWLFSRTAVYFTQPNTLQSMAFSRFCPAVTLECGQPGKSSGVDYIMSYLDKVMALTQLSSQPTGADEMHLYRIVATVKIPPQVSFGFNKNNVQLSLNEDLERYNFRLLAANSHWGEVGKEAEALDVTDEQGNKVFSDYFTIEQSRLYNNKECIPAMITTDEKVIRQDCLCYLMQRLL